MEDESKDKYDFILYTQNNGLDFNSKEQQEFNKKFFTILGLVIIVPWVVLAILIFG